jgi:hypothetical protein
MKPKDSTGGTLRTKGSHLNRIPYKWIALSNTTLGDLWRASTAALS